MGLFDRLYYGKAGKRDYSEMDMPKNRISLFFMVLKDHVFDLIKVNLMQLIFWIPFLLWTYINLAAVQSIDTETVLSHADGAAELCPVCYKQRRWTRGWWPCRDCTLEADRTLVCHDKCPRYAMHRALIWAGKPSKGERAAAEVTLAGKLRSIRHRGTGKVAQR